MQWDSEENENQPMPRRDPPYQHDPHLSEMVSILDKIDEQIEELNRERHSVIKSIMERAEDLDTHLKDVNLRISGRSPAPQTTDDSLA